MPAAIVVGLDLKPESEAALAWALRTAQRDACAVHLVHVLTQRDLEATGAFSLSEKKSAALQNIGRKMMSVVDDLAQKLLLEEGLDLDPRAMSLTLQPRVAEGHAARAELRTAQAIAQVAVDNDAELIGLGRKGRPDSVCDHLLGFCDLQSEPNASPLILKLRPNALTKSSAWLGTSEAAPDERGPGPWR